MSLIVFKNSLTRYLRRQVKSRKKKRKNFFHTQFFARPIDIPANSSICLFLNHVCKKKKICLYLLCKELGVSWKKKKRRRRNCLPGVPFIRFSSQCIGDTWNRSNAPEGLQNHISIVAMAFKCHTRLDTCVIITLRAQPCTFHHKRGSQLCFPQSWALAEKIHCDTEKAPWRPPQSLHRNFHAKAPARTFIFFSLPCLPFPSWQMIRRGTAHAEPNPGYLAEDHTDGPDRASWTHRQLGAMMHRMLPINRMCCSAEATQADTPNRGCWRRAGDPDQRGRGEQKWEQPDQEEGTSICAERVRGWKLGNKGKREKRSRFVGQQRREKKGEGGKEK